MNPHTEDLAKTLIAFIEAEISAKTNSSSPDPAAEPRQTPGCLPKGYTLDSMLTPEQFCIWQQVEIYWFKARRDSLKGVIGQSRKMVRIHPRTYLEKNLN